MVSTKNGPFVLGFGILRRPTSCLLAVVGFGIDVKGFTNVVGAGMHKNDLRRPISCIPAVVNIAAL